MEVKRYLQALLRWWWLALIVFVAIVTATIVFTFTQTPAYEATASLVVSPAAAVADLSEMRASLSVLDKPNVSNTYAEIAQSKAVLQQALHELGLSPEAWEEEFEGRSSVLQNTNIVLITVEGPGPEVVSRAANAIALYTMDYVSELYEVYDLKLLDSAQPPAEPIRPNKRMNLVLGFGLGLIAASVVAFVAEYLRTPMEKVEQISLLDAGTGAYKRSYFLRRLREEVSRSNRHQRPFAVSRMRVENLDEIAKGHPPHTRELVLQQAVRFLRESLPEEDVIAHWDRDELVILLPDSDKEEAIQSMERLHTRMQWTTLEIQALGFKANLTANFGLATYTCNGTGPDELVKKAGEALERAELGGSGVYHVGDDPHD
jgi:diguanylate cyclase (GGDEF)-like protein